MKGNTGTSKSKAKRFKRSGQETKMPSIEEVYEKDLPLMSNVDQIHVSHYVMNLEFDTGQRVVKGKVLLFLKEDHNGTVARSCRDENVGKTNEKNKCSHIILDACALDVTKVEKVMVPGGIDVQNLEDLYSTFEISDRCCREELKFSVTKWSLDIWGWEEFPDVVQIDYMTSRDTPSLHWRPAWGFSFDGEVPICCYTPAAPVNNRGLFPCQEPPSAMATWQSFVKVKKPYMAFLSSDRPSRTIFDTSDYSVMYFNCSQVLPMSTFSIIVSVFDSNNVFESEWTLKDITGAMLAVPIRWIFQSKVDVSFGLESLSFTKLLLTESRKILGPLPFQRLDIILMPNTFPTLGLANPSMIFLSPSLMTGRKSLLYSRLAHEIGHFWFGLSIGALDWTEEWLSEGFATFIEDVIYGNIISNLQLETTSNICRDSVETLEQVKIRPVIRLITLQHELENTSSHEELHYLQPNQVLQLSSQTETDTEIFNGQNKAIKNGLEPLKEFMQVHYLKGYFCLQILRDVVGVDQFLKFLRQYVLKFQGKLVRSKDFLDFFKNFCQSIHIENSIHKIDTIAQDWLLQSKIPEPYRSLNLGKAGQFMPETIQNIFPESVDSFIKVNAFSLSFLQDETVQLDITQLNSTQKIIFLEHILSTEQKITGDNLEKLSNVISPDEESPEVLHRWCEVIIKFKCKTMIETVSNFLLNHPAMGIYLYGELMISEKRSFQVLARKLFKLRREVLDPPHLKVLRCMLF
ncbi:unnamed protein product [Allacma fusca]|uniref:Peptidase M1 leukotriene A4 hydrolase/aminopeptidase C-terminal domain-containing protein n=1 Tax=Allacma fusca TaxID=39272 RepID=A0A8J2KY42_9HEXA|nr:unnamed protein product [Allacma fusca]